MITYKRVLPEILVSLGDNTVFDDPDSPQKNIVKLHMNLENWLGDDLLWSFPEVIVTEKLRHSLKENKFSGFYFTEIEVTFDTYFEDNYHLDIPIPNFYWMKVNGKEDVDDIFIKKSQLYLSEKLFDFLSKNFSINNLKVNYKSPLEDFILGLVERDKKNQNNA